MQNIADAKIKKILSFFRKSYGEIYYGDEYYRKRYLHFMTDLVEINNAKAILVGKRIFSVGTEPSCNRMLIMIELLKTVKMKYPKSWISIESKFTSMISAAHKSGMKRIQDENLVKIFLDESETGEKYLTTINQHGLVIYRSNRKDYFQEIYQ